MTSRTCDLPIGLSRHTLDHIPAAVYSKYAVEWAECNEGSAAGDTSWSVLAEHRAKLILAPIPEGVDRNEEVKRRMRLWDEDRFEELALRVQGQQVPSTNSSSRLGRVGAIDSEDAKGRRARAKTALNQGSNAMKRLIGGVASADATTREAWAKSLIPRSVRGEATFTSAEESREAKAMAWGEGEFQQAKVAMKEANRQNNGKVSLPHVRLAAMCATGPSGERQEHIDDIVKFADVSQRRRLFRSIDVLTVRWAIGDLPEQCRCLLDTQAMFLQKT